MIRRRHGHDFFLDANGCLAERTTIDGIDVVVHYDDIPESDISTVNGVRVTTPLRTVIDIAAQIGAAELTTVVRHCLRRGLFTLDEAFHRAAQPDVASRHGTRLFVDELRRMQPKP